MKAKARVLLHKNIFMLGSMAAIPFIVELLGNQWVPHISNTTLIKFFVSSQIVGMVSIVATYFLVVMCVELKKNPTTEFAYISSKMSLQGFVNYGVKMVLFNIVINIGLLFLFLPGIYLTYRYFFVRYIAIEQPKLSIKETFALSKVYSKGMTLDLIVLALSFILWLIASIMLYGIPSLYTTPYIILTMMFVYYECKQRYEQQEEYQEDGLDGNKL